MRSGEPMGHIELNNNNNHQQINHKLSSNSSSARNLSSVASSAATVASKSPLTKSISFYFQLSITWQVNTYTLQFELFSYLFDNCMFFNTILNISVACYFKLILKASSTNIGIFFLFR